MGVINKKNEIVVPFIYDDIEEYGDAVFIGKKKAKYGVFDLENNILVPFECDTIIESCIYSFELQESRAFGVLIKNGKYGIFNFYTKEFLLPVYDDLQKCFYRIGRNCRCGFANYWNELEFKPKENNHQDFHTFNDLLIFKREGKYGLLNLSTMEELTTELYDSIRFKLRDKDRSIIHINNKMTFLTENKTKLHPVFYDEVSTVNPLNTNFYYKVKNYGKVGVLDKTGKNLLEMKWEDVTDVKQLSDTSSFLFTVMSEGRCGVVNSDNKMIIPIRYDSIVYEWNKDGGFYTAHRKNTEELFSFE